MEVPDRPAELVARHVDGVVEECIADFRVTIVNGPRQVGKTTLLRQLHRRQREVLDVARIRHVDLLPRLFRLLAALTAQELNISALARSGY